MYERRGHPPITRSAFVWRLVRHLCYCAALVVGTLIVGMAGYQHTEDLSPLDAFLNSAMLLGGMGPVNLPQTDGGKLFAGLYALFCGTVVIMITTVILAPIVHRIMHHFHWTEDAK